MKKGEEAMFIVSIMKKDFKFKYLIKNLSNINSGIKN